MGNSDVYLSDWLSPRSLWTGIAVSADGQKITAVSQDNGMTSGAYSSNDGGATFFSNGLGGRGAGKTILLSSDSTRLASVSSPGYVYTSNNSGVTSTQRDLVRDRSGIALSSDGVKLVATVYSGNIYTSTDSGVTWTGRDSGRAWRSVASNADGTKLAAVVENGSVFTSTDSALRGCIKGWKSIASSLDGTKLAAAAEYSAIYVSADSGVTWKPNGPSAGWSAIACSSDCSVIAATGSYLIYTFEGFVLTFKHWSI